MASPAIYHLVHGVLNAMPDRIQRPLKHRFEELLPKPDYFLVSYPKSGRTWLRVMIGSALIDNFGLGDIDAVDIEGMSRHGHGIPTIRITHDMQSTNIGLGKIRFRPSLYANRRVIFLVRDPRDVLTSFFYAQKYRRVYERDIPQFSSPEDMVKAEVGGLRAILKFDNVWADNLPSVKSHLIVHYEDLKADPAAELRRCLEFLGIGSVSNRSIDRAIDSGRVEKMREAERQGKIWGRFPPPDLDNVNTFKVRKGVVGGHVEEFSGRAIERMNEIISNELSESFSRYKYS